jgi:hypothetical protein
MTDMMVKIMVEVLDILGTATQEMKQSRFSEDILRLRLLEAHLQSEKFLKNVAGITKLFDGLKKLDKMTNDEARMANAEALRIGHVVWKKVERLDKKVQGVGKDVECVSENVIFVKENVQKVIDGTQYVLS